MMTPKELGAFVREHFTRTAFRWEALPAYEVESDGNDYGRYMRGEESPDYELTEPWRKQLRSERARGLSRRRVRLLHHPLTPYERYECEWGYVPNSACGENIRVLPPDFPRITEAMPPHDFWLIDDKHAIRMHYGRVGEFHGATLEPDLLDMYRRASAASWAQSVPFDGWWEAHPELHRDRNRKVA